ncbi:rho GTPase-activating protein 11A isoform X1 [Kryptolebias marmoratus]|uniref:Rho GTPase activating protein 11A n=1 Tax=Kryptolebias marmoratus TaxID=37003 RepID=A0A3Q2ZB01_KRYMA|nr:rho GTPase-activating protein 11A isoform X1 [Kryptolebias marmoratus]
MKVMESNVMRLVAVQHLRSAYGIKIKSWNKSKTASCKTTTVGNSTRVFGVPLDSLPFCYMEWGRVPRFLFDSCVHLLAHVDTEGLFRKSGSVVRLKALRAKLDAGEECLSTAPPCDVAGLLKQFFRELPEPVLPTELQDAFFKAQQLPTAENRTSATLLLSCVLPDRNISVLRYFFDFLHSVSQRSAENRMDSSNLSVIMAPNLLHSGDGTEKMNANTEKRLKLQAAVVHCFIENAHNFGVLPQFLQEKVPAMMGCEAGGLSPAHGEDEEGELNSGMKRKSVRSFGLFSSATSVIVTPSSKRKLPFESRQSFGFSNKKRRSIKKSLGIDLLPNPLFSGSTTPGSAYSLSGVLDSSPNTLSSAGRSKKQPTTSSRRKSKRFSNRHVTRVESGKAGCFSPKVGKKDDPRKSLRKRFSLGKSSKDAGSESIGWRLAAQESTTSFLFTEETKFSPFVLPRNAESKSSKYISKSEDNLLTPQYDSRTHRASWIEDTPLGAQAFSGGSFTDSPMNMHLKSSCMSEPAIVIAKPSPGSILPMKLCCASSAESLESAETQRETDPVLLKTQKDATELGPGIKNSCSATGDYRMKPSESVPVTPPGTPAVKPLSVDTETPSFQAQHSLLGNEQNIHFSQAEIAVLTPLHIDSTVFESSAYCSPVNKVKSASFGSHDNLLIGPAERMAEQINCSRFIDALDVQSPAHFTLSVSSSTPYKLLQEEPVVPNKTGTVGSKLHERFAKEIGAKVPNQPASSPTGQETEKRRVAEHIQHFNKLTLYSPTGSKSKQIRSPLKFHRTPVRQTVRRINSLSGDSRRFSLNVTKSLSLESGLSPHSKLQPHPGQQQARVASSTLVLKKPPPVPPKRSNTLLRKPTSCALGDMTNKVQPKVKVERSASDSSRTQKNPVQQVAEKDTNHYRGSPRNPLNTGRLLSATKPVDL